MLNLLIFGAPGSGKGTQSKFIAEHFGIKHISTGDLLRKEVSTNSELGHEIESLISEGHLVPDEMILEILFHQVNQIEDFKGVILDGFPRTLVQAESLIKEFDKRKWSVPLLVVLEVPEEELMTRLLERGKVSGRSDDNEETIRRRFQVYRNQSEPIVSYYKENNLPYASINGLGTIQEITDRLIQGITHHITKV